VARRTPNQAWRRISLLGVLVTVSSTAAGTGAVAFGATRTTGPAHSVLIVEETPGNPLVTFVVAARSGSAGDPKNKEGLAYLAAEVARRGAAGRSRAAMEDAFDELGASLHVEVDPDATRLWGQVLARNLDPFLDLLADIVLRPDFPAAELDRSRKELVAQIEEARNDDRSLCSRFFERRLYGPDHPYGHPSEGTTRSLPHLRRDDLLAQHRKVFVGENLIFAASGAVTAADLLARLQPRFGKLAAGPVPARPALPAPVRPDGWRLQIVDKPDRQQTQIMFGHPSLPANHPDRLALGLVMASFGGRAMNATLMDEVRTKRGLAYGAYMSFQGRQGPGALRGWVHTAKNRTVTTLKLVLRLFKQLRKQGIPEDRLTFMQGYLVGALASEMDDPSRRLEARVTAELNGLPADEVDTLPDRLKAVTPAQVQAAIKQYLDPEHLAITLVATSSEVMPLLLKSKIEEGAIDVVPYDKD
jgi:zinc protease